MTADAAAPPLPVAADAAPTRKRADALITRGALGVILLFQVLSIITMFREVRPGVVSSAIMLGIMLLSAPRFLWHLFRKSNGLFIAFFAILLLSQLNYLVNPTVLGFTEHYPDTFVMAVSYLVIPCLFFFTAGTVLGSNTVLLRTSLERLAKISLFCIACGVILQATIPGFYAEFLLRVLGNNISLLVRMSGYLGNSMIMGAICATAIPLVWYMRAGFTMRAGAVMLCLVASALSLQRGSMAAAILVTGVLLVSALQQFGTAGVLRNINQISRIALLAVVAGFLALDRIRALQTRFAGLGPAATSRAISLSDMVGDRSFQWEAVGRVLGDYPLGLGIGMMSHVTAAAGFPLAVPDGNYFRILGELGPLGLILFLALLVNGMRSAVKRGTPQIALVLLAFAGMAVGTNVFDFYYSGFLFWIVLGMSYAPTSWTPIAVSEGAAVHAYGTVANEHLLRAGTSEGRRSHTADGTVADPE